jgi:hypothetical protein
MALAHCFLTGPHTLLLFRQIGPGFLQCFNSIARYVLLALASTKLLLVLKGHSIRRSKGVSS